MMHDQRHTQTSAERVEAMFERHCILLEHLGRLVGLHDADGVIPVGELRDVLDRDIARTLTSPWGGESA